MNQNDILQIIVSVIGSVIASSGFWSLVQKRSEKKDGKAQVLIGLAHDRIVQLGMQYIERGYITEDEYSDLNDYLFVPYEKIGGNGSAARIMKEVRTLPLKKDAREAILK